MTRLPHRLGLALSFLVALLLAPACTPAAGDDSSAADRELIAKVSKRLLDVCDAVPAYAWPPQFILIDSDQVNAYAVLDTDVRPPQPVVRVCSALMRKVVAGDPDRLALILGHELSHILLRHVDKRGSESDSTDDAFSRNEEREADRSAMELMLKAGFSLRKARTAFVYFEVLGLDYSSFEGRGKDHPSWDDRMARIDDPNSTAWKSMSAYDSGVMFLATEQYPCAEMCFERVTKDFPNCYEAWTNIGFACLMEYCDVQLDVSDLRDYGIGQVLVGGFYFRRDSIPIRGQDMKWWYRAVGALNEALRLKDDLILAKEYLGIAYLFHPAGIDVAEGTRWLQEAADAAATDKTFDPADRTALLANLGVAELAAGKPDKGLAHLDEAEKIGAPTGRENPALRAVLLYNRAQQTATGTDQESKEKALKLFEEYLDKSNIFSAWWPLAYAHYASLCKTLNRPARDESVFRKAWRAQLPMLASVKLKSGEEVTLGEDVKEVVKKLGAGRQIVAAGGTNIRSIAYDKEGIKLLVSDVVKAICLINTDAPELSFRPRGPGADKRIRLHVGMGVEELQAAISYEPETVGLTDPEVRYRFYRDLGLAVRIVKGRVIALVVGPVPEARE